MSFCGSLIGTIPVHRWLWSWLSVFEPRIGIATGLVWRETGGEIYQRVNRFLAGIRPFQAKRFPGGGAAVIGPGCSKFYSQPDSEYGISDGVFSEVDMHIHFPARKSRRRCRKR